MVGDDVWVTGRIGNSFASGRHLTFTPRVEQGWWLAETLGSDLHAMIDVSDGLGRDAGRIAERSGVGIEIEAGLVPRHVDASEIERAIADGEDYELLFAASPEVRTRLEGEWPWREAVGCTRIGRVVSGSGCFLVMDDGVRKEISELGWDH
jgi:thiamine-monophosphate kinase